MKYPSRIYYTETDKSAMWDRWQKGDSMHVIARLFDRGHSSVQRSCRRLVGYVHDNEVDQNWRLRCRNAKRYLAALWPVSRFDR